MLVTFWCRPRGRSWGLGLVLLLPQLGARGETSWAHDVHIPLPLPTPAANDVRGIAVEGRETIWVATADGVYRRADRGGTWSTVGGDALAGPSYALDAGTPGGMWIGHWKGLARVDAGAGSVRWIAGVAGPVRALASTPDGQVVTGGPEGFVAVDPTGVARPLAWPVTRTVFQIVAPEVSGEPWWVATAMGAAQGDLTTMTYRRGPAERASYAVRGVLPWGDGRVWLATLGGVQQFRGERWRGAVGPVEGWPSHDARCVRRDSRGRVWVGTTSGLVRWSEGNWEIRRGRRWLLHDEVRDVAFDAAGTAWVATAGGVSGLGTEERTLAAKAGLFHQILEARHVRPPGIVGRCELETPGDLSTWRTTDDDNDGGYTAVALAMESYRYAVTRAPEALAAARRAFAACEFLQRVTGTEGFVARSVVPVGETRRHDPNTSWTPPETADQRAGDARDKYVPVRWRPSADGRWEWKGDTSSDEITAHFFGYFCFHELAADAEDRRRVREQVCRVADHLIAHGYELTDLDGQPTRWGVWSPRRLNHDPNWEMERGINSLEILSFLKLAHRVSGEAKYDQAYRQLIQEHGYARNARTAPNLNPAWRTHIDLELLAFAYPTLLALEEDPALRRDYRHSLERWHNAVRGNANPFFEFLYAIYGSRARADLTGAREFLRRAPLDLVRWDAFNDRRDDVRVVHVPELEFEQTHRRLAIEELSYDRTDQNPWMARQGDGGRFESDGVFWLLPYWMGRYAGLLGE